MSLTTLSSISYTTTTKVFETDPLIVNTNCVFDAAGSLFNLSAMGYHGGKRYKGSIKITVDYLQTVEKVNWIDGLAKVINNIFVPELVRLIELEREFNVSYWIVVGEE